MELQEWKPLFSLAHTLCFHHILQEQMPWDSSGFLDARLISLIGLSFLWGFGHYQARVLERLYFSVVSTSQMGSNRSAENVQNVFL